MSYVVLSHSLPLLTAKSARANAKGAMGFNHFHCRISGSLNHKGHKV